MLSQQDETFARQGSPDSELISLPLYNPSALEITLRFSEMCAVILDDFKKWFIYVIPLGPLGSHYQQTLHYLGTLSPTKSGIS